MASYRISVTGRVQGVSYRRYVEISAERLGIRGYVKNLANGNVEVVAEGDKDKIDIFLNTLKKGNPYSFVENIEISEIPEKGFNNFEIRY